MLTKWYSAICIQYFEKPLPQPEKKSNRKIEENPNLHFAKYHLYTEEEAHNLDYQQSLFFFRSVEQKGPRHANDHARGLRRSTLARACTPLTKSEEKERLLAVYP